MSRQDMDAKNSENQSKYQRLVSVQKQTQFHHEPTYDCSDIRYYSLKSLAVNQSENTAYVINEAEKRMFLSQWSIHSPFYYILKFDGDKLSIYIGTEHDLSELKHVVYSAFPGIEQDITANTFENVFDPSYRYMGSFRGNPVVREYSKEGKNEYSPIDELMNGTIGISWIYCISAHPIMFEKIQIMYDYWMREVSENSEYCSVNYSSAAGIANETMNTEKKYTGSDAYFQLAQKHLDVLNEALYQGQWNVTATLYCRSMSDLRLVGNILSSAMRSGTEEIKRPFPMHFHMEGEKTVYPAFQVGDNHTRFTLTSSELATMCSLPTRDSSGFPITENAEFDISRQKTGDLEIGNIMNQNRLTPHTYSLDPNSLNRHGLIIGLTGGGKTNTVKSLLHDINKLHLPFMVIEPAKKEYYELYRMGMTDLQVYSVGSNSSSTLKINPFECMEGISLQSHIDVVFSAFKASFIMYSPMPYVLENAIYGIYKDRGWDIETGENKYGRRDFPTLEDLYYKIQPVVKEMGYDTRMQNDLIGSLTARINSLRMGAKGRSLNVETSTPLKSLLQGKVVIELDDVGDEDAKAFIISLILMQLQECRKSEVENHQLGVQHILLIEEAHRLLKNISSGSGESADPRGAAVEYFCNMLAEIRSKGQGFLVIDQIPSKLAPDLIKNTNLKIVHRTVDEEDRMLIGGAMHMTDAQKEYLARLGQGVAAVYSEGDDRPKLVKLPYAGIYEQQSGLRHLSRDEILSYTAKNCFSSESSFGYMNQGKVNRICSYCLKRKECMHSGRNAQSILASIQPVEHMKFVMSVIQKTKNPVELYKQISNMVNTYQIYLNGFEKQELTCCLIAAWYQYYEAQMDYTAKSDVISYFLSKIRSGDGKR